MSLNTPIFSPYEWNIRGKLLAAFVVVALFTCSLGLFAVNGLASINDSQNETYVDEFGGLNAFTEYLDQTWRVRLTGLGYLLTENPAGREAIRQQIANGDARVNALAARLDAADLNRDDVQSH